MTSCSSPGRQPMGSQHHWEDFRHLRHSVKRILKNYRHASDYSSYSWSVSGDRGRRVAISTKDPSWPSFDPKILTRVTQAIHLCPDALGIDEDCLGLSLQDILPPTSAWTPDSPHSPSKSTGLLGTLRSFLKPSSGSSLFSPSFPLRSLQWFYWLLVTKNSGTPDALVNLQTDKYPEKRDHGGNPSSHASPVEASSSSSSSSCLQREIPDKSALDINYPFQVLNSSSQADPSSPSCVSFVGQSREHPSICQKCKGSEVAHDVLPGDGVARFGPRIRNFSFKSEGYVQLEDKLWASSIMKEKDFIPNRKLGGSFSDPEDDAGFIKREQQGYSRAPTDGETSKKPPKRQRQNSHYDEGTHGTTKTGKRRKRDSVERGDDDFDDSGRGGRPNTGKRGKDEEEESAKNKFACPFYKNDPQAFRGSRTCVGPGWSSVHRVKSVVS